MYKKQDLDQSIMNWLSDHSATILIIAAVASFFITGFLEFFHYKEVFSKSLRYELATAISVMFALFFQGVRCATIANSAKQFREARKARGAFVLTVSLAVTVFCAYEAQQIASTWEAGFPEIAGYIHVAVLCIVWAGWVLELILVVSVAEEDTSLPLRARQERKVAQEFFEVEPLMNGNGATH